MFCVDEILAERYPSLQEKKLIYKPLSGMLRSLLHERQITAFTKKYSHLRGVDFAEQVLEQFDFDYTVRERDKANIPTTGRVMIVANHPIGTLDGLSLLKMVHSIRPDVKIVANDFLYAMEPLRPSLLPVNNTTKAATARKSLHAIYDWLKNDHAVIIFPAGEVSRLSLKGIHDCKWNPGFLKIAGRTQCPIVPVHASGHNSHLFYSVSLISKPASTFTLLHESFKHRSKNIRFTIGKMISHASYTSSKESPKRLSKRFSRHTYRLGRGGKELFKTTPPIALPEKRSELHQALHKCEQLGTTSDGKEMYLYHYDGPSPILREIGRLRECAFRSVEEGTNTRRDTDCYDINYDHLILWDAEELEVVGAYRFAPSAEIISKHGINGLYTNTLFNYHGENATFLKHGMELGRSFIQPKYQGRHSLEYLWNGVGAYMRKHPECRYLFGPVTISNGIPDEGKDLLIHFYNRYFGAEDKQASSRLPFNYSILNQEELESFFCGTDYKEDFKLLKARMRELGSAVPTLYKQYSELCEEGGVEFHGFNVDPDFNDCVDGLIVVDSNLIKNRKRTHYFGLEPIER